MSRVVKPFERPNYHLRGRQVSWLSSRVCCVGWFSWCVAILFANQNPTRWREIQRIRKGFKAQSCPDVVQIENGRPTRSIAFIRFVGGFGLDGISLRKKRTYSMYENVYPSRSSSEYRCVLEDALACVGSPLDGNGWGYIKKSMLLRGLSRGCSLNRVGIKTTLLQ